MVADVREIYALRQKHADIEALCSAQMLSAKELIRGTWAGSRVRREESELPLLELLRSAALLAKLGAPITWRPHPPFPPQK